PWVSGTEGVAADMASPGVLAAARSRRNEGLPYRCGDFPVPVKQGQGGRGNAAPLRRGLVEQFLKGLRLDHAPFVEDLAHLDEVRCGHLVSGLVGSEQKHGVRGGVLKHHLRAADLFPDEAEAFEYTLQGGERDSTILHG